MPKIVSKIRKYAEWRTTPEDVREPKTQKEWAKLNHVSEQTVCEYNRKLDSWKGNPEPDDYDKFMKQLMRDALRPNAKPKDRELIARLKGWDKPEQEEKIELTADDYYRIEQESEARLSDFIRQLNRAQGVPEKPVILPGEVCVDTEQKHSQDS